MIIRSAIEFTRDQINSYLRLRLNINEDRVVIDNVVNQQGTLNTTNLSLSLVNIEEESVHKAQSPYRTTANGSVNLANPEIKLNLYLLLAANFGLNYEEALLNLSHAITFFQGKQVFNHQNSPALNQQIEKLIVELHTLPFEQQNYIWGCIGATYIPLCFV
ncbi:MAG: Pvc16 family protein [Bacteroidota bacterium]